MAHRLIRKFHFVVLALCQFTKKSESLRNLNEMEHAILPISSVKCKCPPKLQVSAQNKLDICGTRTNSVVTHCQVLSAICSLIDVNARLM